MEGQRRELISHTRDVSGAGIGDRGGSVSRDVDDEFAVDYEVIVGLFELQREHFMATQLQINNLADSDIDNTEEALVTTFELALIKDLDGHNRRVLYGNVKVLVPIRVEGLLDHAGGVSLLRIDSDYCERVGKPEDLAFGQAISRDDCNTNLFREASTWVVRHRRSRVFVQQCL